MSNDAYHHGHLREALIKAASQQIEAEGAQALNLSKLARQLEVSQPAVYRHFANKQALILCLAEQGFEQLTQSVNAAAPAELTDAYETIQAIAKAYVSFVAKQTELARLMFSLKERVTNPELYAKSKQAAAPVYRLADVFQQHSLLRSTDVPQTVRIIWASIHGLAVLLMDGQMPQVQTPEDIDQQIEATARVLSDGLFTQAHL